MLSHDDSEIEIEDYGRIHHNGKLPVYQTYGDVSEKSISDVVLGNMNVAYVTAGKEVCAILILQPADIKISVFFCYRMTEQIPGAMFI